MKEKLFSLLPGRDLIFKESTGSGPGGQNRNRKKKTISLSHPDSGVTVKAGDERSQHQNKVLALRRLVGHKKFKTWVRLHAAMIMEGFRSIAHKVDMMMKDEIKIEYVHSFTCDGCGTKQKTVSQKSAHKQLPKGWIEAGVNKHWCIKCQKG